MVGLYLLCPSLLPVLDLCVLTLYLQFSSVQFQQLCLCMPSSWPLFVSTHRPALQSAFLWFIFCLPCILRSIQQHMPAPCQFLQSACMLNHLTPFVLYLIFVIKRLLGGARPHCWLPFCGYWVLQCTSLTGVGE